MHHRFHEVIFLGCRFAAKYPEGGGNFSVPLQWARGIQRTGRPFYWLEILPACADPVEQSRRARIFQRRMHALGFGENYILVCEPREGADLDECKILGVSRRKFNELLAGANTLLNLCYSVFPPMLSRFEKRILCDLDPGEVPYWMGQLELGQSTHHELWTIGLNIPNATCTMPRPDLPWRTFFPLVDTPSLQPAPRPEIPRFTTVGQWYWKNEILIDGHWRDLSKGARFEPYLHLPREIPEAVFELAMNIAPDDPVRERLLGLGWKLADPHRRTRTPGHYQRYLCSALAEFTSVKGVDTDWQTGWISDRAAMFLALGRPVITEDTGAAAHVPADQGLFFIRNSEDAGEAVRRVLGDWPTLSRKARELAEEMFSAERGIRRILDSSHD